MEHANLKELIALDVDGSDNLTEEMLFKFIQSYGGQLHGNLFSDIVEKFRKWSCNLNQYFSINISIVYNLLFWVK